MKSLFRQLRTRLPRAPWSIGAAALVVLAASACTASAATLGLGIGDVRVGVSLRDGERPLSLPTVLSAPPAPVVQVGVAVAVPSIGITAGTAIRTDPLGDGPVVAVEAHAPIPGVTTVGVAVGVDATPPAGAPVVSVGVGAQPATQAPADPPTGSTASSSSPPAGAPSVPSRAPGPAVDGSPAAPQVTSAPQVTTTPQAAAAPGETGAPSVTPQPPAARAPQEQPERRGVRRREPAVTSSRTLTPVTPTATPAQSVAASDEDDASGLGRSEARLREAIAVAVAAGRSPWTALVLLIAILVYVVGQRALDRGSKLACAGRASEPDDELIEL